MSLCSHRVHDRAVWVQILQVLMRVVCTIVMNHLVLWLEVAWPHVIASQVLK